MWVMTTGGFLSAVQDQQDSEYLMVRSRDRQSIEVMVDTIEMLGETGEAPEIISGAGTDYPYRARVHKGDFADFLSHEVRNYVSYPNFKNALTETRGKVWHDAAMQTWVSMLQVTDEDGKSLSPAGAYLT